MSRMTCQKRGPYGKLVCWPMLLSVQIGGLMVAALAVMLVGPTVRGMDGQTRFISASCGLTCGHI